MKLEIAEVINHVGQQSSVDIETPCPPDAELECADPIRGRLTLTNTGRYLLVRGDLGTAARVPCSRCLKQVLVPLSAHIEDEFPLPTVDARGVPHWGLEGEPVQSIVEDYLLDVDELARQHLELAMPTAPVCDEACLGLCPGCGKNLNEGPCICPPPAPDERLAGLRALLEKSEGETET